MLLPLFESWQLNPRRWLTPATWLLDTMSGSIGRYRLKTLSARSLGLVVTLSTFACSWTTDGSGGAPCGRNQHAFATVTLPDTGIDAKREIQVSFIQHDPDLAGELSEVAIQQAWAAAIPDTEPDPRVRLVTASGQVLIDTLGTRFDQPTGNFDRPTWLVLHWIREAPSRNALYNALATQALWLELWHAGAAGPGTRVLLTTKEFGVNPPAICL
jgi:hypothetical protein